MSIKLTDLKLYAALEEKLNAVTPDQLASLKPGAPVPEGATIVGELAPALKAFLYLRAEASNAANRFVGEMLLRADQMNEDDARTATARHEELVDVADHYNQLFWNAFKQQYAGAENMSCGYGPQFEAYVYENKGRCRPSIIDMLAQALFTGVPADERPARH